MIQQLDDSDRDVTWMIPEEDDEDDDHCDAKLLSPRRVTGYVEM